MLASFKAKLLNTAEKKRLASNIVSLGLLQGANYLLPLLTVPYLVRVLGPEYFGLLAFANATIIYFVLLTDYGFQLTATRQISIYRNERSKINEIFSAVMVIKSALMLVSFALLSLLVFGVEKFNQHWEVYFITFGMVVGQVLFPVWLFQGMERMKYITFLNIAAKSFFTICIFVFINKKEDYLLVPLFTSLGFIAAGVASLYIAKKDFDICFYLPSWKQLKYQLVDGWHVFLSSISISLYTNSTIFILGMFTNNSVVGYFSAADKIIQAVKGIYQPISQAIYPLINKIINQDEGAGLLFIRKTTKFVGLMMLLISLFLFLMADPIVNLMLGEQYERSILLLQIMAFLPFFVALSNIFGVQTMLSFGYKRAFSRILVAAAFIGILLSVVLVPIYEDVGTAITLLMVESLVTGVMFFYLYFWKKLYDRFD